LLGLALRPATRDVERHGVADPNSLAPLSVRVEVVAASLRFAGACGG
jgi:hypothetical protein